LTCCLCDMRLLRYTVSRRKRREISIGRSSKPRRNYRDKPTGIASYRLLLIWLGCCVREGCGWAKHQNTSTVRKEGQGCVKYKMYQTCSKGVTRHTRTRAHTHTHTHTHTNTQTHKHTNTQTRTHTHTHTHTTSTHKHTQTQTQTHTHTHTYTRARGHLL
jgi:hypothetical protein